METNPPKQPNTFTPAQPSVPSGTEAVTGATPKPDATATPASPPPGLPAPAKHVDNPAAKPDSPGAASPSAAGLPGREQPVDKVCWRSEDGLVTVLQKVRTAGRHPQHNYPVIVLQCLHQPGTRIRHIPGGQEIMLTHPEVEQFLGALSAADSKVRYEVVQRVPGKDPARKAYWDRINQDRHRRKWRGQAGEDGHSR